MDSKEPDQIDTNLYSRQIGTFGLETMGKLIKMQVAIVGLRGLGVECAKNLILAGPKSVMLYDPEITKINDLGANFYTEEAHVGKVSRAEACQEKLRELNPYVKVEVISEEGHLIELIKSQSLHVVCQTEMIINDKVLDQEMMDSICRDSGCGYISSQTFGPWGYAFVDYGDAHMVTDADGEQTKNFIVVMIEKGTETVVTTHEDKRHTYQEGDFVEFKEVEGMTQINETGPYKVIKTTKHTFTLELDSTSFGDYAKQGIVENKKVAKPVQFHAWKDSFKNPAGSSQFGMLETPDLAKFGRSDQLHAALFGIMTFVKANGKYPEAGDVEQCMALANGHMKALQEESEANLNLEIEEDVFKKAVSWSGCSISPMAAFFGGIIAQEIVKKTGKYSPLKQWLHFDIYETIPREEVNRAPLGGRYDDQIKIYGQELQAKLAKVNLFMVGAGALGCELIKAFALMGIGCSQEGLVSVTDNDNIEVSNLNRQFLFRQNNVGHSKSQCATQIAKCMNNQLNVKDYMTRVGADTEDVFNDDFWEKLDFVVNAVDNIHARLYVDQRCVWYEKPLLESGTLGTKANSQMIVPHVTQCYGDSQDPPEEAIPMCTLRNFPNQIEHCIEWGRDKFNDLFVDTPGDLVSYLDNSQVYLFKLKNDSTSSAVVAKLQKIVDFIKMKQKNTFEDCVLLAKSCFNDYYHHAILDLLSIFPKDHVDKEGSPFWSGPKRAPSHIEFDPSNSEHVEFILAYANLIAAALTIPENRDIEAVKQMAAAAQAPAYVPKKIKVQTPEEEKENQNNNQPEQAAPEDEELIEKLSAELESLKATVSKDLFVPAEFEKDDDDNFHIAFINACANLRAMNYQIPVSNKQKTKMIAGKIIPAIATTTAMITGAVTAEIYKFVQGYTKIEDVKNGFINLALPLFLFSEPTEVNKIKSKDYDPISMCQTVSIPDPYTIYDKTLIDQGSLTIQEMIDYLEKEKGIEVTLVTAGQFALYNAYLPGDKQKLRLTRKIEDVYAEVSPDPIPPNRRYLQMELGGSVKDDDEKDFQIPTVKYVFMK